MIMQNSKKIVDRQSRPIGENIIKADAILGAWHKYCRESRIYRLLEFLGLR
jgi:glucose-6-phosphate 1-dehydrogenase